MSNQKQRAQDDPLKYFNLIDKVKEANTTRSQEDADARIEEREEEMRAQIMGDKFRQSMDAMGQKLDDTAESVITFDQKYNPNRQEGLSRTLQADIQRAKKVEEAMSNLPELEKPKAQEKYKKQAAAITDFDLKDAVKGEDKFVHIMNSPSKQSYKATFGNYGHDGYGRLVRITNNTMENIGLNDYLDGVSAEVIKDMPRNRRGNIMVGGKEYTEEEVKAAVTPLIIEANHEALMSQSHEYRDEVFKANTGMTYKQWATSRVQDLAERVTELRKIVGDAAYWEEKERAINTAKSIGSFAPETTARNIALGAETEAQKPFDDFIEQLESWAYNDFGSGFSATFDGMSVLTGGLVDLFGAKNMSEVLEAAERGEKLDVRGQAMLELHMIQEEIAGLRDVVFAPQSTWNKIGEGVGTSAGEIGGFAIGMLAGGGIGSFANLGVKGAVATTKYAAKKSVLKGIGTGIAQTTKVGARLTYNAGLAYTRGAVGSLVMPSTYTRYYEGVNSQYSVKEDGTVTFTPKDAESSFLGYWVDNASELTSEMFGVGLGKVLSFGSRWFGRTIALNKVAQKMRLDSPIIKRAVKKLTPGKTQKKVMSYLGVSGGAIAEPLSEVYGDFFAQVGRMAMGLPYDFNQFSDADYWKTTAMVSTIYGGSLSVGATAMNVPSLYNVHQLGKMSRLSLNKIEDEELRNKLELITIDGNIERASQELAGIDWSNIASTDRGYAFDYIRHNYAYQVALGERQETTRMNQFAAEAHHITSLSYRGIDGKEATGNLVLATLNDGRRLFVLEGNYTDADGILKCTDELGNVEPIHVSHLKGIRTREVESEVSLAYDMAFKGVIEEERMNEIEAAYKGMRETGKLKEEDAKRLMADYGVSVQIGEKTQLVDGREAVVEDIMDDGYILVGVKDATTGEMELLSIPFYDIMSSAPLTAEVQSKRLAERTVEKMTEEVDKESSDIATEEAVSSIEGEAAAGVEVETTTPTNGNIEAESTADTGSEVAVGKIIRTKNGQQARVMAVNEDGSIEVDYNLDENSTYEDAEYDVISAEDVLSGAAEDKQKKMQETPAEEDAAEETKEIINEITEAESIPQTKDGNIDYDAIDNPEQFSALYEREAGDKDTAINDVREMRAAAEEQLAKSVEKGKKLSSANEKTANRNERKALTERIAFYDAVLDILTHKSAESASESAEADIVEPQTEVEPTTETTSFTPGLVEDEYTAKLSEKSRKALHDVAVALGLRVRFVDAVRTAAGGLANADISGNEVRIAWSKRDKAISFLVGHEFTHRMQELSPKEYASFKESVKAYMGDERWNALVAKTRSIYEAHNAREMARAEAEHRAPRLLQYSVELIEDEVVADFAGELNEDANALAAFAEKLAEKPSTLKAVIAVLRDILNKLKGLVAGAEAQRLANMLSKFEELYRASASRTTEGQTQSSKEKYSLRTIKELKASLDLYNDTSNIGNFVSTVKDIAFGGGGNEHLKNIVLDYEEAADEALFAEQIGNIVGDFNGSLAPYTAGGKLFSLPSQVADILNDYDTEGAEYGSILDVADGIEALIAASAEDTTELENILNDFRAAQDDARRWGNRMDSGGEEELEEALRAYVSQSKAEEKANTPTEAEVKINANGEVEAITDEQKGQGRFSLSTYHDGGRATLASFLNGRVAEGALTEVEATDMLTELDEIAAVCEEFKEKYVPFGAWSEAKVVVDDEGNPVFSVIKANGDYAMNLDFSLVCKKRRTLDAVLNQMVKRGMIKSVSQKDTTIAKINEVIRKYGFETACALCFVDARRFQVIKTAHQFCDLYNDTVDLLIPKKSNIAVNEFNFAGRKDVVVSENTLDTMSDDVLNVEALRKIGYKVVGKTKDGKDMYPKTVVAKIARHLVEHPEDRKHLSPSDFVSTAGFDKVKEQKTEIMKLYNAKKGTGGPKAAFSDVQYLNDIIRTNWKVEEAYAVGGVRLQSFSDYVPRMVFDYIQMVAELAAKKLPVHAYTKESLFAKTFGLTGMKINLSLVPDVVEGGVAPGLDAEGNYVWKKNETFPYEEAVVLQNAEGYKNNCGTIAVGISDEHIWKMLDDVNIRMVIPYHKSGLPKQVAKMNNVAAFTDYTNMQNTRNGGRALTNEEAKQVPNYNELLREANDPRKAAQAYLDWCAERGYTPKFEKFATHPNYYKLLEDFTTMVDGKYAPQEAVTFTFPTEESAFGSLESLIEQGLEEDAVLEGQRDVKVDAIVEEVGEVLGGQPKFSLRDIANDVREYDATNGTELYDWLSFVESGSIAKNKTQFHIANTGEILNEYGIKGKINVTRKAINTKRHTDNDDHELGVSGWAFLVATINSPLVITRYNNEPNSYRIYTIAEINGKNICAGVDVNATNGVEITKITTAFGRDITKIEASSKEKEIYRNENAAEQISGSDNSHLYARLLSTTKVIQNFENPKIEPKKSLRVRRLSMPMPDDIFFDDNGDIIRFGGDDVREATTIVRRAPKTTEERIKMYMESRHLAMMQRIRMESDEEKKLIRRRYNEEREKRTGVLGNMRGASVKIDYILGDTPREALPLYDQALILLAEGEVKIRWEDDGTLKGLASELGYKKGEKARMRNITGGATLSFEAFVHQWWQSIGGYANGIDTQDMRNALIEALQDTGGSSTRALAKIRSTYDVARTERDNSLYDVDARRESALAEEEQRYKKEIEAFDTREDKAGIIRQYEQSVAAYDEMESIDGLLRHLDEEIRAMRSRAERAESRESQSRKDIYEGIRRGKQAIMEAVRRIKVLHYNSQELNSLLSNISAVRSIKQLSALQERVENIITSIQIREENNNFDKLLNLRLPNWQMVETWVNEKVYNGVMTAAEGKRIMSDMWRGTNSRGVAVAKYVDQATGDVMRELRDMVSKVKKRRYEDKEDENGEVKKVLSEDKELSMDIAAARKANGERAIQLATKNLRGEATAEEITEMKARYLYSYYLDVVEAKQNMLKAKSAFEEAIGNSAVDTADARSEYFASKEAYRDVLRRANKELDEFITKGRDAYKSFMEAQEEHRQEIVRMGLNAIGKQKPKDGIPLNWWQTVRVWNRRFINNPYWTFETTLREIDHLSPNGKGVFYNFWMQQAQSASDEFVVKQITHVSRLGEKVNRLWGFKYSDPATAFMAIKRRANEKILLTIKYTKYDEVDGDIVKRQNSQPITIANGLYMLAMWGQERYRRGMEKQGITVNDIMSITQAILNEPNGEQYIAFKDWVIGTFLTDTREEYDVTHQRMFGTSMDKEANYFPAKVVDRHRDEQLGNDNNNIGDLYVSGIIRRQTTSAMIDAGADFFAVLGEHIQSMDRWSAFAELQRDIKYLINSNEFKDRLVAHMPGKGDHKDGEGSLYRIFFTAAEILLDKYKSKATVIDNIALMAQKGWATANISWRWMTAIKQLASLPTFLYYAGDLQLNKLFWKNVAKYGVGAWKYKQLHDWCKSVSPSYRRRWQTGDMGIEFLGRKISTDSQNADIRRAQHPKVVKGFEWFDKVFTTVGKDWGMFANKAIDAFSVAVGLRTIYEFEVSRLTENGKKELTEEMKKEAVLRAEMAFNATQQSSENAYLAEIQKQRSVASAVVTTYLNQPFAMHRLRMGAMNELWNQFFNSKAYVLSMIDKYGKDWQKEMRAARHRAYAEFMQGILSDYLFQLIGTGIGGVCLLSAAIDDDEDETLLGMVQEVAFNGLVSTTFGGYLGGNLVQSAIGGYFKRPSDLVSMPAQEELISDLWETVEALISGDATVSLYNTLEILARYRYGVDPETALNMVAGVEAIIKDEGTAEGILKILNAPRSQVALVAGKRREGESVWEYIDRRVRVELIGATPPATELFDEDNMKYIGDLGDDDYKVKKLFKDYNEAQTAKVWKKILTEVERLSFAAADVRYADICALIGWKPGSMPKDEAIDKSVRPYIYPAGLDSRSYKTIKREATAVEEIRNELERFVGTDEAYAEKLRHMYDKMQKLINIYDGINK